MKINTTLLKEKSIIVNQFVPSQKMQINMNRINMMPDSVVGNHLQCELKLSINIEDDKKNVLAVINVAYVIIAVLEEEESYKQDEYANRIFNALQSMYILGVNDLLKETPLPPIPFNIDC